MRWYRKSLGRAQKRYIAFQAHGKSIYVVHRRKLWSYTPHRFCITKSQWNCILDKPPCSPIIVITATLHLALVSALDYSIASDSFAYALLRRSYEQSDSFIGVILPISMLLNGYTMAKVVSLLMRCNAS